MSRAALVVAAPAAAAYAQAPPPAADYAVVGKYLSVEPYAIMLRKDEPQLEMIVDRALIDLFQSGEIRKIYAKWFATKELTVPMNQYLKEAFSVPNTYPAWP